jgi:membrane fusion protein (multidrug efflux system)
MSGLVERATIGAGAVSRGRQVVTIKRLLAALAIALGLVAATTFGVRYWEVGRFQVETDDAYVQADSIIIAPRVPGYIAEVLVNDNQPVKAGQVLARIDDRDLCTALDQASADRQAAEHKSPTWQHSFSFNSR